MYGVGEEGKRLDLSHTGYYGLSNYVKKLAVLKLAERSVHENGRVSSLDLLPMYHSREKTRTVLIDIQSIRCSSK
jgi:hypothetical protein